MKRLLAFILLLSALFTWCFFPILGAFAIKNVDSSIHQSMGHDMSWMTQTHNNTENNSDNILECCKSSDLESITRSWNTSVSYKDIDDEWKGIFLLHENQFHTIIIKLHSPPKFRESIYVYHRNIYVSLIGIIKNNS
jgi:hypothetical protein